VQVDKRTVTATLRAQGEHDRAQRAECVLPRHVDTERDAGLLLQIDVHPSELEKVDGATQADAGAAPSGGRAAAGAGR
jgi:hypothetical protein